MKNKKILSRILALCSVAVLLFAIALPCFADETTISNAEMWQLFYDQDTDANSNLAYKSLYEDQFSGINPFLVGGLYTYELAVDQFEQFYTNYPFLGEVAGGEGQLTTYVVSDVLLGRVLLYNNIDDVIMAYYDFADIEIELSTQYQVIVTYYDLDANPVLYLYYDYNHTDKAFYGTRITLGPDDDYEFSEAESNWNENHTISVATLYAPNTQVACDDLYRSITDDDYTVSYPRGFALGYTNGYAANRPDGVVPPAKTGLFGQLYYILSDAIYGENVVLGSTQDFALTLVTTLLVLCVVLLPVLLVVAIMFKLFRW